MSIDEVSGQNPEKDILFFLQNISEIGAEYGSTGYVAVFNEKIVDSDKDSIKPVAHLGEKCPERAV